MEEGRYRELLEQTKVAVGGINTTVKRQEAAFEELFRRMDQRDALSTDRHEALMREHQRAIDRYARHETRVVEALGEMSVRLQRNTDRLDDMGEAIRADTQAVLSMLDRLGPPPE